LYNDYEPFYQAAAGKEESPEAEAEEESRPDGTTEAAQGRQAPRCFSLPWLGCRICFQGI
jgi:hypothetical protein